MRNSPVTTIDTDILDHEARAQVGAAAQKAAEQGTLALGELPADVADQVQRLLEAVAAGNKVSMVAEGKALTSTEAAELLGMSPSHLKRLCKDGRIPSYPVGNAIRIDSDVVMTILRERGAKANEARTAAATADQRRRARAAKAAGLT